MLKMWTERREKRIAEQHAEAEREKSRALNDEWVRRYDQKLKDRHVAMCEAFGVYSTSQRSEYLLRLEFGERLLEMDERLKRLESEHEQ